MKAQGPKHRGGLETGFRTLFGTPGPEVLGRLFGIPGLGSPGDLCKGHSGLQYKIDTCIDVGIREEQSSLMFSREVFLSVEGEAKLEIELM